MSEWIEWKGGECPLKEGMVVDVKLRHGVVFPQITDADDMPWKHIWGLGDIIAYRVVKEKKE